MTAYPLHSPDFYVGDPYPVYKELRATKPVCWNSAAKFWALLKYEDIRFVSTNPVFSSAQGITIPDPERPSLVQEGNLIFTDPPRHRQLRKLISAGFTRRQVSGLESKIRELVSGILDKIEPGATHEFVEEISAPLPTKVIADMLGAPAEDWEQFHAWSDAIAAQTTDPGIDLDPLVATGQLFEYFTKLIAARRVEPRDDLLSALIQAEVDGEKLTDEELLNFSFLLLIAGNETTRNLVSLGTLALIAHPDQHRMLARDPGLIPSAVEEMLRWTSPVAHFARTATADTEIRGQRIRTGEVVVMLYGSANRDEEIFGASAEDFKVTRNPNPHIAFGCGVHSCLGAQLARLEARIVFEELLRRYPNIELAGEVVRMRATTSPGVKRMPVQLRS
ncbi:linalool 8-monooxygenase [Mycobacterium intracellulare]|nr:linalool 8-monooxygenase [Mycobacterium intracellulare]